MKKIKCNDCGSTGPFKAAVLVRYDVYLEGGEYKANYDYGEPDHIICMKCFAELPRKDMESLYSEMDIIS